MTTRAPSKGRGCRAQRGGVGFLFERRSRLLLCLPKGKGVVSRKAVFSFRCLPHRGRGTAQRRSGALVNGALETIVLALFHAASTLSGSLRSPPSPRGEGFVSGIPLSPSNLRPFGAPPSIGRRECPHEPLPLEGAAECSEAGLAFLFLRRSGALASGALETIVPLSFIPLEPYPARSARHLPHAGKALFVVAMISCKDGAAYKSP